MGDAKLASCPGCHLTTLRPYPQVVWFLKNGPEVKSS